MRALSKSYLDNSKTCFSDAPPMTNDLLQDALRVLNRYAVPRPAQLDLRSARKLLDPFIFDGDHCRDDVAEICQKLDDILDE